MKAPIKEIEAVVAAKIGNYNLDYPEIDPDGDPIFRVAFETNEGTKIFEVSSEEYYRLEVGMQGLLKYQGPEILSFGDWIVPFKMN